MKKITVILIFVSSLLLQCEEKYRDAPDCLQDKIRYFAKHPVCEEGAKVGQWTFQGETVYVFSEGTCANDLGATVYNALCEKIAYIGGYTGNTKINGVNFYDTAEFVKILWEN